MFNKIIKELKSTSLIEIRHGYPAQLLQPWRSRKRVNIHIYKMFIRAVKITWLQGYWETLEIHKNRTNKTS